MSLNTSLSLFCLAYPEKDSADQIVLMIPAQPCSFQSMYTGLTNWNLVNSCAENQAQGMKQICFILACNDMLLFTETIKIVDNLQIVIASLSWKLSQTGLKDWTDFVNSLIPSI